MKVTLEMPDETIAIMVSYITKRDGYMAMSLQNIPTPELLGGETIKCCPSVPNLEKQEV